jgi:hypothetical protein
MSYTMFLLAIYAEVAEVTASEFTQAFEYTE